MQISHNSVRKYLRYKKAGVTNMSFLQDRSVDIRRWFLQCQVHCVPLIRKIKQETGTTVKLRTLQRFCQIFRQSYGKQSNKPAMRQPPAIKCKLTSEKNLLLDGQIVRVHFLSEFYPIVR